MSVECVRVEAIGCVRNKEGRMMNAERCVCCEKGERRKRKREREKELREQRETFTLSSVFRSPIPSHPIVSLSPCVPRGAAQRKRVHREREQSNRTRRKGKDPKQQQAGGKTKNRPAYIELACDDDDRGGGGGGGGSGGGGYDDEGGTHI